MEVNFKIDSNDLSNQMQKEIIENVSKSFEIQKKELVFELNKQFTEKIDGLVTVLTQGIDAKQIEKTRRILNTNLNRWFKGETRK